MKKQIILIITIFASTIISGCLPTKNTTSEITWATTPTVSISDTENQLSDNTISGDETIPPEKSALQDNTLWEKTIPDESSWDTTNYDDTKNTQSAPSTDELVDKLADYAKSWEFDEDGVDLLYEIIDTLSE